MANILPTVFSGHALIAPSARTVNYGTDIAVFEDTSEQRFSDRLGLQSFSLSYSQLSQADRAALDVFVAGRVGSFDNTWAFALADPSQQLPLNGSFAQGLAFWTTSGDGTYNALTVSPSTTSSRAGETNAYILNNAVTLPAGAVTFLNLLPANRAPGANGQTVEIHFACAFSTNAGLPAGMSLYITVLVNCYDSGGTLLGTITAGTVNQNAGWSQQSFTAAISFANTASYSVVLESTIKNPTASSASLPFNCCAFIIGSVQAFVQGQTGIYTHCVFQDDSFAWTENASNPGQYDGSIRFRQTAFGGTLAQGTISAFPTIEGARTGFPFISTNGYTIAKNDIPSGWRWAYALTGTSGYPSRALKSWRLNFPALSNSDAALIEQHFVSAAGSYHLFSFTDPTDGKTYSRVRYASDSLSISYKGYNLIAISVQLLEVYGSGWTA